MRPGPGLRAPGGPSSSPSHEDTKPRRRGGSPPTEGPSGGPQPSAPPPPRPAPTWLAHGELHRTARVQQLLHQRLGQHGGREEHGPSPLAVDGAHQAVGRQAEVPAELALGVQLWEGAGEGGQ